MILIDRGYYDYDFSQEAIDKKRLKARMRSKEALEIWDKERVASILNTAINPNTGKSVFTQDLTADQMQQLAREEMGIEHKTKGEQSDGI